MLFIKLIYESFLMAVHSVTVNKLRTLLTLLGIAIGIFAIISVLTAISTMESTIRQNISALGNNVIYIQKFPWSFESDYKWWEYQKRPVMKYNEYEEIVRKAKTVDIATFSISSYANIKYDRSSYENGVVWANTYDFQEIKSFEIENGRYFTPFESNSGKNLALIGNTIAKELFKGINPIDKYIKVNGHKVKVIGVIKREGSSVIGGGSLDEIVLIPLSYAKTIYEIRSDRVNPMIMVRAKPNISVDEMKEELKLIMRKQRTLKPAEPDDFALNQASMIIKGIEQIFGVINFAGWIIGAFSILVGGFGIANIMFVTVRERTNQIGIQKAVGAKRFFILVEFLSESVLLSLAGGLIGLFLVFLISMLAKFGFDVNIVMNFGNVMLGVLLSVIIGVVSGLVPAWFAARLDPVKAINTAF